MKATVVDEKCLEGEMERLGQGKDNPENTHFDNR